MCDMKTEIINVETDDLAELGFSSKIELETFLNQIQKEREEAVKNGTTLSLAQLKANLDRRFEAWL